MRVPEGVLSGIADQTNLVDVTVSVDDGDLIRSESYQTAAAGASVRLTMRYDDFGIDVDVQPPPADQVQESPAVAPGGHVVQSVPLTGSTTPADKQRACDLLKSLEQKPPAGSAEQQKQQYQQFLDIARKACAGKP